MEILMADSLPKFFIEKENLNPFNKNNIKFYTKCGLLYHI